MLIAPRYPLLTRRSLLTSVAALAALPANADAANFGALAGHRDPWSPHVLTRSILKAWWDAGDHGTARMTDDGAGLISNWVDRIGGMAITAATTARGTWSAAAFNSAYPGITLDGVANCYVSTTLTTLPTGANAGWIFYLADNQAAAASVRNLAVYGANAPAALRATRVTASNGPQIYDGTTTLAHMVALTGPMMVLGIWSGTTQYGFINGATFSPTPSTTIASLNTGTVRFRIGADLTPVGFWQGPVALVMVGAGLPDQATIDRLYGWSAWNFGLTSLLASTHPYKTMRP